MPEDARIDGARAEGTSHRSANPSAVSFSVDLDVSEVEARGFDCSSDEARYVIERIGMHRLSVPDMIHVDAVCSTFSYLNRLFAII